MKFLASIWVVLFMMGCVSSSSAKSSALTAGSGDQSDPCAMAGSDKRMEIKIGAHDGVSICRADGLGDCLYTLAFGRTYVHSRPDLNSDGRDDYLIENFIGPYGINDDVHHFMGFVGCTDGTYVEVMHDVLTDVTNIGSGTPAGEWTELQVTRACFDESLEDVVTREYTVAFDQTRSFYGPPDGDPELADYCTDKERSLPIVGDSGG